MVAWEQIKKTLTLEEGRRWRLLPIGPALDRYEAESGFLLPRSFREFGLTFGIGTLQPADWRFAMPGFPDADEFADPAALTRWLHECWGPETISDEAVREMGFDDPARARRLVLFGRNGSSDFVGWDPVDVIDPEGHEYGIYLLGRYDTRVLRLATRFHRFVLTYGFGNTIDVGEPEPESEKCEVIPYLMPQEYDLEDIPPGFYPSIHDEEDEG